MKEYKIENNIYRIKVTKSNPVRYIVQRKTFLGIWMLASESEEEYYFHMDDALRSLKEIENYKESRKYMRVRADGTLYYTTADFFRLKNVRKQIEKMKDSDLIKDINNRKN